MRPTRARRPIPIKMSKQTGRTKMKLGGLIPSCFMYVFSSTVKDGEINTFQKGTLTENRLRRTFRETEGNAPPRRGCDGVSPSQE